MTRWILNEVLGVSEEDKDTSSLGVAPTVDTVLHGRKVDRRKNRRDDKH